MFALIGTTYGSGDNSTTFNLPDLGFLDGEEAAVVFGYSYNNATGHPKSSSSVMVGKQAYLMYGGALYGGDPVSYPGSDTAMPNEKSSPEGVYEPLYAKLSSAVSNKVCYIIKAFSATSSNSELVDVTELSTEITKKFDPRTDYTIIYPNNGTEQNPAELSANTRYVETNPFPGYAVKCAVEYYMTGVGWGETTWICVTTSVSRGTVAFQLDDGDIVVQTASGGQYHSDGWYGGTPFGNNPPGATFKCRVKVWKVGKLPSQSS